MASPRYSARVGESLRIVEGVSYDALLKSIMEFTARAAVARSIDEVTWEQEQLRHSGIGAIQLFRDGKALWSDAATFEAELQEARREHVTTRFQRSNEVDPAFYERLDRDLRARWRQAGYESPTLLTDMKRLFAELERDAADRAASARELLAAEIVAGIS